MENRFSYYTIRGNYW